MTGADDAVVFAFDSPEDAATYKRMMARLGMSVAGFRTLQEDLVRQGRLAKDHGFWLEAISVRMYLAEFWLRQWVVMHSFIPYPKHGPTFGRLIERAEDCHLSEDLVTRLRTFNGHRNEGIHRLLNGNTRYADLRRVFEEDENLTNDLGAWISKQPISMHRAAQRLREMADLMERQKREAEDEDEE